MNYLSLLCGRALLISGPSGSGKNVLANDMVLAAGFSHPEIGRAYAGSLYHPFGLSDLLGHKPKIVIVDDVVPDKKFFELAKSIVTSEFIRVEPKGQDAYLVQSPLWIFTTNKRVKLPEDCRHFRVITLDAP